MQLYSMRDAKSDRFAGPFVAHNYMDAQRMVALTAQAKGSSLAVFPQDYTLFLLGDLDEKTGIFKPATPKGPKACGLASEILAEFSAEANSVDMAEKKGNRK